MAKDHARVNVTIWTDPDFRALPPAAQHLYLMLWTSPDLSYCGVHDWRPARLTGLSRGFTADHIRTVADCLAARFFIAIDDETEEVLVRSWARFDGLMKQPRMAVSYASAYAIVGSQTLRQVIVHETRKMHDAAPDWTCWRDKRVAEILDHPSVSAKDLPAPIDPFGDGVGDGVGDGLALGLPQTQPKVCPSVWGSPTPAPTPATNSFAPEPSPTESSKERSTASRKRPATRLDDNWTPNDAAVAYAVENHLDLQGELERFRLHAQANDRRQADWNAAFRMWLSKAQPVAHNVRQLRTDDQGRTILPPLPPKTPWGQ